MEAHLVRRPVASCCCRLLQSAASAAPASGSGMQQLISASKRLTITASPAAAPGGARFKSSTSRTKRALNVPPEPSFAKRQDKTTGIIFNPPSSSPSVFNTPFKFLPKSDPRRRANLPSLFTSSTTTKFGPTTGLAGPSSITIGNPPESDDPTLPPAVDPAADIARYRTEKLAVTPEMVAEIRRLRVEDPWTNSGVAMAQRFNVSHSFIRYATRGIRVQKEYYDDLKKWKEDKQARWGPRRRQAREDRARRLGMLFRGEL
ncbi:mitochondrial ribosomal protein subunit L20-domain-containing protein [Lasiosphaeria miniovina]|uniref:Mitochondrial ribosomal protein subunit L20-domain-containing protein n=1 Tax=Lasiosphaeria miniovina TaxID=1954250 RepID=A0AA40E7R5_9PEZI|nr:mitochondrial ribosomal protein subunit L20-domain-containing protein [Lasiosphaeria miniovina]KAK0727131.1 mitochondrial ribosomal protein subunit L20-domain-containing protein [Lasiosphaeria miniovina]